jgi:hypothetical protein
VETLRWQAERTWFAIRAGEAHAEPVAVAGDFVGEKLFSYEVFCRCGGGMGAAGPDGLSGVEFMVFQIEISAF